MGDWRDKRDEYQALKSRRKARQALKACGICGEPSTFNCVCGTIAYCSQACKTVDWRDRGHREACERIRDADAAAPSPPPEAVVYGPAPRSDADEARARIAAEHEAARAWREANPEREPASVRWGSRCPVCFEDWDVNDPGAFRSCCARKICDSCADKVQGASCPLCRSPCAKNKAEILARVRQHAENDVPEAVEHLATQYRAGALDLVKSMKKAAKLYKRAVSLGSVRAMANLAIMYQRGEGVKMDQKKGLQLSRMAADRGDATAEYNFATSAFKQQAIGGEEALLFLSRSAEKGYAEALYALGLAHFQAEFGVSKIDLEKAKSLLTRALARGFEQSREALRRVNAYLASGAQLVRVGSRLMSVTKPPA